MAAKKICFFLHIYILIEMQATLIGNIILYQNTQKITSKKLLILRTKKSSSSNIFHFPKKTQKKENGKKKIAPEMQEMKTEIGIEKPGSKFFHK